MPCLRVGDVVPNNEQDLDQLASIRLGTAAFAFKDDDETELVMRSASSLGL